MSNPPEVSESRGSTTAHRTMARHESQLKGNKLKTCPTHRKWVNREDSPLHVVQWLEMNPFPQTRQRRAGRKDPPLHVAQRPEVRV